MHRMITITLLVGILAGLAAPALHAAANPATFPVVDGDTQAVIVGAGAGTVIGWRAIPYPLQTYIQQSTGRKLKVVNEQNYDPATMPYPIYVGNTRKAKEVFGDQLAKRDIDSYIVSVTPDYVILVGGSDQSGTWARFDFLRTYLGVDSYFPDKLGLVIPKHETVRVPAGTRIEVPRFRSRAYSALNTSRGFRAQPIIPYRMWRRYQFHHAIQTYITVEEFGKTHPEYFPERNGKRQIVSTSAGPGPCISNPDVVRIITEKIQKRFDDNPERKSMSLGMTDGGWCECAQCRALDDPENPRSRSNRYYWFLNQVGRALQKSHPGKLIGVLGYAGAERPPTAMKAEKNILPYLCYTRANWYNREVKRVDLEDTAIWTDHVDQIGIYEYLYGGGFSTPRIYTHYLQEFLQFVDKKFPGGNNGFYAEIYSNHGFDGPKAWITEKLLWDPYVNVDKLLKHWCRMVFDEAAPAMQRYFERLERTRIKNGDRIEDAEGKFALLNNDKQLLLFPPDDIDRCLADLEQARRLAKQDIVKQRIEYFASTFRITELLSKTYHAYLVPNRMAQEGAPAAPLLAALIEADKNAPEEDPTLYIQKIKAENSTKFSAGVEIALATEIGRGIVLELAGNTIYQALQAGERDPAKLVAAAKQAILDAAPSDYRKSPIAKDRIDTMLAQAERVAVAHRVKEPVKIDGNPNEKSWQWVNHHPWFAWKSGAGFEEATQFALQYDDQYLYVALRCPQKDLAKRKRGEGRGVPGWKYASVEFFINPDERDADPEQTPHMQIIPTFGGGIWELYPNLVPAYAITDDVESKTPEWRAEIKLDLEGLKMDPSKYPYLRINFVRNVKEGGHSGKAWFPSSGAHKSLDARGWLIFE